MHVHVKSHNNFSKFLPSSVMFDYRVHLSKYKYFSINFILCMINQRFVQNVSISGYCSAYVQLSECLSRNRKASGSILGSDNIFACLLS